ncbi:hypothetical protein MMC13_004955 [Lambiella insularis]|nr:hypothetical protein [Lambiella insularis]
MGSCPPAVQNYWGYLIEADKTASPRLEDLLLGIAQYINNNVAPWDQRCLSPSKLAAFYKIVGGNYDVVFLETSSSSLAYIYKSLGCYHTLQPVKNPFAAPSIPALTPQGFVRWQTIQLLLGPEEHVLFLQEALKRLDIKDPNDGETFPRILPRDAFPARPDPGMTRWHDIALGRCRIEGNAQPLLEPRRSTTIEDGASTDGSSGGRSITDATDFVKIRPKLAPLRPNSYSRAKTMSPTARRPQDWQEGRSPPHNSHRRSSVPRNDAQSSQDDATPTEHTYPQSRHRSSRSPRHTSRSPRQSSHSPRSSVLSITSGSETTEDTATNSEASSSPRQAQHPIVVSELPQPYYDSHGRRHSAHSPYDERDHVPKPQPRKQQTLSPQFFISQHIPPRPQSTMYTQSPPFNPTSPKLSTRSPKEPAVRFSDVHNTHNPPSRSNTTSAGFAEPEPNYFDDRPKRRPTEPVNGVGGRRYPAGASAWRP